MTKNEITELLKDDERYKTFTVLDEPVKFNEFFKDKQIGTVQLYSLEKFGGTIIGFCGCFSWKDNILTSIDHDLYSEDMTVYGYEWWENEDNEAGLDILVGNDW